MHSYQKSKGLQYLQYLGLTQNQAKVYLALVNLGISSAKEISQTSKIAQSDVYRVINQLLRIGLLEVLVTSPKKFRAAPPEHASRILLKQKEKEVENVKIKARELATVLHSENFHESPQMPMMSLIPGGYRVFKFGLPKLLGTEKKFCSIQTNKLFQRFIDDHFSLLKELSAKGIEMRFIIESPEGLKRPSEDIAVFLKNSNFKVRFAKNGLQACILLLDTANVFICSSLDPQREPSYWSDNPCLTALVDTYFETVWRESFDVPLSRTSKSI